MVNYPLPRSKLASSLEDHEELLVEHQQLASRHEQLLQEAETRREGLERALREEATKHSLQSQEQTQLILQLREEIEGVTNAFKKQLQSLQEDHNKVEHMHACIHMHTCMHMHIPWVITLGLGWCLVHCSVWHCTEVGCFGMGDQQAFVITNFSLIGSSLPLDQSSKIQLVTNQDFLLGK